MTRLSLCMIVRDEMQSLDACLDSAEAVADEIVIADTGSRDGTWERVCARAHRPLQFTWRDDFAAARNAALDQASGAWVLVLDADERLAAGAALLRSALEREDALAYRLCVRSDVGGGRSEDFHALRLFRRHPALRWSGRIHEQVSPALRALVQREPHWRVESLGGVRIDHDGYRPEVVRARGKRARNLDLLQRALAERPGDPYLHYKLAQALGSEAEGVAEASTHLEEAGRLLLAAPPAALREQAIAGEALTAAAQAWIQAGRSSEALAACRAALEHAGEHPATRLVLGQALLAAGLPGEAAAELERALETSPSEDAFFYARTEHAIAGSVLLAEAQLRLGALERAAQVLERARREHPDDPRVTHGWLALMLRSRCPDRALRDGVAWLATHPGDARCLLLCADAAEALGQAARASHWRRQVAAAGS